jgi:hypothetical protein
MELKEENNLDIVEILKIKNNIRDLFDGLSTNLKNRKTERMFENIELKITDIEYRMMWTEEEDEKISKLGFRFVDDEFTIGDFITLRKNFIDGVFVYNKNDIYMIRLSGRTIKRFNVFDDFYLFLSNNIKYLKKAHHFGSNVYNGIRYNEK